MTQHHSLLDLRLPLAYDRPFYVDGIASPHKQLVLKSPKADVYDERIDICFRAVDAVCLNFKMESIEIRTPTKRHIDDGVRSFGDWIEGAHDHGEVFAVICGDYHGLVVASVGYISVNELHGANASPLLDDLDIALRAGPVFRLIHEQ
jgi:hypothetical protein